MYGALKYMPTDAAGLTKVPFMFMMNAYGVGCHCVWWKLHKQTVGCHSVGWLPFWRRKLHIQTVGCHSGGENCTYKPLVAILLAKTPHTDRSINWYGTRTSFQTSLCHMLQYGTSYDAKNVKCCTSHGHFWSCCKIYRGPWVHEKMSRSTPYPAMTQRKVL